MLEAQSLVKRFPLRAHPLGSVTGWVEAVKEVSLSLRAGESVGLVGESGCGKSTLARLLCKLIEPTAGTLLFKGRPVEKMKGPDMLAFRRSVQLIFQDPYTSLDPLMRIGQIVAEPLIVHRLTRGRPLEEKAQNLLKEVGLDSAWVHRLPQTLSGGQRQRVGIARALALDPQVLICDEPVSSLDLSVQAQILGLLSDLQRKRSLALLFISHNLATVSSLVDRLLVMKEGEILEEGNNPQVFQAPRHPYTQLLVKLAVQTI